MSSSNNNQKTGDGSGRFMLFCKLCDEIGKASAHTEKVEILKNDLDDEFSKNTDLYLLFKLLLPEVCHTDILKILVISF